LLRAFSLVEMLIVSALLSVIVLGLMAMFGQTQRAFRIGLAQTDVLDAGRAATELIGRELGQMRPSSMSDVVNFFAEIVNVSPLLQNLPGMPDDVNDPKRINFFMDTFFLSYENQRWTAIGYTVRDPENVTVRPSGGVGALYVYYVDNLRPANLRDQVGYFLDPAQTNFRRVADGVVHLRARTFNADGVWILPPDGASSPYYYKPGIIANPRPAGFEDVRQYFFLSNAVPAAVEIELGFLESRTLERAKSIPNITTRREFLERQAGRVHLFRQRIPIHSVDIQAYQ
jgi:prepilin-type N-terminal cleavage/methylation domain-containing protein